MTTAWTATHLAALRPGESNTLPLLGDRGAPRILPDMDFWDLWPVRTPDGAVADVCGTAVWAGLSAPAEGHPGERHDSARIRLVRSTDGRWRDLGPLFPDGATPGSREWAGSLVRGADGELTAYYTAAGVRGEDARTFRQRIMTATARLECTDGAITIEDWSSHRELITADGHIYQPANEAKGEPGFIKAFRDPFPYQDPADGAQYLLFTASLAGASSAFNGCIGLAHLDGTLLRPLITADGVNNELERPHVVTYAGSYYLFFSTQRRTFAPGVTGPTGLYGFVGPALTGPYEPLNGSGLVLQNPPEEPYQAYSWLVLDDLCVTGFVDAFALHGRQPDDLEADGAPEVRAHFGGTITPPVWLALDGTRAEIVKRGEW